jgi:hypothetical protein
MGADELPELGSDMEEDMEEDIRQVIRAASEPAAVITDPVKVAILVASLRHALTGASLV